MEVVTDRARQLHRRHQGLSPSCEGLSMFVLK